MSDSAVCFFCLAEKKMALVAMDLAACAGNVKHLSGNCRLPCIWSSRFYFLYLLQTLAFEA